MSIYSDLSDEDLATEIAAFREARRSVILGGDGGVGSVKRISDGDRTIEYTSANLKALESELAALIREQQRRNDPNGGGGRAILVEFD